MSQSEYKENKLEEEKNSEEQDTLSKYIDLNSKCDEILERIKERKRKTLRG